MATYKNLAARGRLGRSAAPTFILGPLHISITNGARKLKFGTLVGIYAYTSPRYKNLSARGRLGKSGAGTFYFGTSLISPKLIELES